MRVLIRIIAGLFFAANAAAQNLPSEAAEAYRAYEAAVDAGNWAEASTQAEIAWRAADTGDVDPATVTILAANYGEVALITGNNAGAAEAYERAAILSEAGHGHASELGRYLVFAARARLTLGEYTAAMDMAVRSIEQFSLLPEGEARYGGLYQANTVAAYAANSLEQFRRSGRFAQQGMDAMRYFGPVSNPDIALLAYLAAIQANRQNNREDALYYILVSRMIAGNLEMDAEFRENSYTMQNNIMARTDAQYFDAVYDRIRSSGYVPRRCFYINSCQRPDSDAPDGVINSVPLLRTPPRYPSTGLDYNSEGYVDITFNITAEGRVVDAEVTAASSSIFVRPALTAIRHWRYWPRNENGVDVPRVGVQTRIEFMIED